MVRLEIVALVLGVVLFLFGMFSHAQVVVRTAAQQSIPKYYKVEKDGAPVMQGLCVEILRAIEKQDPSIQFKGDDTFLPVGRIYKQMEAGELDCFVGSARTAAREKIFHYLTTPLYEVNHVVAVRADDDVAVANFDEVRALKGNGRVLTYLNSGTHRYLDKQGGLVVGTGTSLPDMFNKLMGNRARFIYYHDLGLVYAVKEAKLTKRIKILPTKFRTYHHEMVFSLKTAPEVIAKVQAAVDALVESGEMARIHKPYVK